MSFLPNGTYTLTNQDGEHRTFKVHTKQRGKYKGSRVIGLLTGQDNEGDYNAFGFVDDKKNVVYIFRNRRTRVYQWYGKLMERASEAIQTVFDTEEESVGTSFGWKGRIYTIQLAKRCLKCNRKLTDPTSIRLGIGPVCRGDR